MLRRAREIMAVTSLPRPILRRLWLSAIAKAASSVSEGIKDGHHVALVLHAVYFNPDSTEFVPLVDAHSLNKSLYENSVDVSEPIKPLCVVNLIDDIYDVYGWLRSSEEVFDSQSYPVDAFDQMEISIRQLQDILVWRQAEAGASSHLASVLDVPCWTVATKHPRRILARIFDNNARVAYLSHSISEPRRQAARGADHFFSNLSQDLRNLSDQLSPELAVWEPTTIDELRIMSVEFGLPPPNVAPDEFGKSAAKKEKILLPRLSRRWPFRAANEILWPGRPGSRGEGQLREQPADAGRESNEGRELDPAGFFSVQRRFPRPLNWMKK